MGDGCLTILGKAGILTTAVPFLSRDHRERILRDWPSEIPKTVKHPWEMLFPSRLRRSGSHGADRPEA